MSDTSNDLLAQRIYTACTETEIAPHLLGVPWDDLNGQAKEDFRKVARAAQRFANEQAVLDALIRRKVGPPSMDRVGE